jgi:hypothetical protein
VKTAKARKELGAHRSGGEGSFGEKGVSWQEAFLTDVAGNLFVGSKDEGKRFNLKTSVSFSLLF